MHDYPCNSRMFMPHPKSLPFTKEISRGAISKKRSTSSNNSVIVPQFIFRSNKTRSELQVDIPGVNHKKDVEITIENSNLQIKACRRLAHIDDYLFPDPMQIQEETEESSSTTIDPKSPNSSLDQHQQNFENMQQGSNKHRSNYNHVKTLTYKRTFRLGEQIDKDGVRVKSFKDGVLTLVMPNTQNSVPRKIQII